MGSRRWGIWTSSPLAEFLGARSTHIHGRGLADSQLSRLWVRCLRRVPSLRRGWVLTVYETRRLFKHFKQSTRAILLIVSWRTRNLQGGSLAGPNNSGWTRHQL